MNFYPRSGADEQPRDGYLRADLVKGLNAKTVDLTEVTCAAGTHIGRHVHQQTGELYYFARGSARVAVAGQDVHCRPGDALFIEPGEPHEVWVTDEAALLLVVARINAAPGDVERL